ncbi:MAG: transporter [Nitrospirae bacterium]|nr:transporter [Nitrospirota bacterium]
MHIRKLLIFAVVIIVLVSGTAFAHHPSGGAGLGQTGPIRTVSATTLPQGKLSFAAQAEFIDLDGFSDSQLLGFAMQGKDAHTAESVFHSTVSMGYGITDNLSVSMKVSYEKIDNIREAHGDEPGEIHLHGNAKGIGDLTLMGQYRFLKTPDNLESALFLGLKIPTGKTNDRDIQGETFEAEFLPGTGSWNPILGIAATKRYGKVSLDGNLQYTFATRGTQFTNLGDMFDYNAALSYRVVSGTIAWDLILEANGEWKGKQRIRGEKDPNSGGNTLFLSPGMRLVFGKNFSTYLSIGIPLLQDMNGIQDDTKYKALFGASFSL